MTWDWFALVEPYCRCAIACDCDEENDAHIAGAWADQDHAHDPTSNELRDGLTPLSTVAQNRHAKSLSSGRGGPPPAGRGGASETRRAPAPVSNLDELAARRNTRPLSSTVDNVVPIRRTNRNPSGGSAA